MILIHNMKKSCHYLNKKNKKTCTQLLLKFYLLVTYHRTQKCERERVLN